MVAPRATRLSAELYAAFLVACLVVVIVPGPTVTLIIANSVRHGVRAGHLNAAGTQLGLSVMIAIVGIGLTSLIEAVVHWFDWLRLAGAAYLVWLGWKMIRSSGEATEVTPPRGGFLMQGVLVALSNPKTLIFFGAFFPQFIDPARDYGLQIAVMASRPCCSPRCPTAPMRWPLDALVRHCRPSACG